MGSVPVRPDGALRAAAVRWERLRLSGFGRHRDLRIDLPPGLATWVAPNEAGKSTAVAGLVATLWGVPHVQDATGFAWGRFRAFGGGPHRGEVTFERDGERFTVVRAFDTHRVLVVHHASEGDALLMDSEHNPNARRERSPYLPWLEATLGLADADLVLATFVVTQGDLAGPPHALGHDVQALVAGAGGGSWRAAQEGLEAALRACTRRLRGLAPGLNRDGRQDQALELAEAHLEQLQAELTAGRGEADAFVRAQRAVETKTAGLREAEAAARRARAAVEAQRGWIERRDDAVRSLRRWADLERARTDGEAIAQELAAARAAARLHGDAFGEVDEAAFEARLDAWASAVAADAVQRTRLVAAEASRGEALRDAHASVAAAFERERALRAEGVAVRLATTAAVAGGPDDQAPLEAHVAEAEAAARRYREGLAAFRRERARAAAVAAEVAALEPLAGIGDAERADLSDYRGQVAAWATRLSETRSAWEGWRARLDDADERFGEVADLEDEVAADLVAFARAEEGPEPLAPWRWWGAILAAALAGGVALALGRSAWGPALAGALAWAAAWPRRPTLRRARRRLGARLAAGAVVLEGDDARWLELARRREAYEAWRHDLAQLRAGERAAAGRLEATEAGAAAFRARWAPLRDELIERGLGEDVDLGAAHDRFERATAALQEAEARAGDLGRTLGAEDPSALAADAPAEAAGADASRLWAWGVRLGALAEGATVADLDGWLARLGPATWSSWREAAQRDDVAAQRRRAARQARQAAEAVATRVAVEHERAVVREERARDAAAATLEGARSAALAGVRVDAADLDPVALRALWREQRAAAARVGATLARIDAHLRVLAVPDLETLAATVETAGWEAAVAVRAWRELVVEHPSLPAADLATAAHGAGVDPGAAFAEARAAAAAAEAALEAAAHASRDAHEALARAQGSDPIDVATVEVDLAAARAEVERRRFERDALALAATELAAAVEGYRSTHQRRLEVAAAAHLEAFSGVAGRRVRLDEGFRAAVREADGRQLEPVQLSQGARDQLALALRWAVADLIAGEVALPLVLDDPFLNWDEGRAARVAEALRASAVGGRQVWLLSHRPELGAWGDPVTVRSG